MKSLTVLFALMPAICCASGITNGDYEVTFIPESKGMDRVIGQQDVTITNLWWTHNMTALYFDVVIERNGSLKRFDGDRQVVRGLVYEGKFKFVIPYANVIDVTPHIFEGINTTTNDTFEGNGSVEWPTDRGGPTPFHFWMKRKESPNKAVEGTAHPRTDSPSPHR